MTHAESCESSWQTTTADGLGLGHMTIPNHHRLAGGCGPLLASTGHALIPAPSLIHIGNQLRQGGTMPMLVDEGHGP